MAAQALRLEFDNAALAVRPIPDLSWIPVDEEKITLTLDRHGGRHRDRLASQIREMWRISELWHRAVLADDRGTAYVPSNGSSGTLPGSHKGENAYTPAPPADALELNLTLEGLSLSIPLRKK